MNLPENGEQRLRSSLPERLLEDGRPVFAEPWQAQAFAMTLDLYNRGLFSWSEWTDILSEQLSTDTTAGEDPGATSYYSDWLVALERLVSSKTAIRPDLLTQLKQRWEHAYRTTPHGEKVTLQACPLPVAVRDLP